MSHEPLPATPAAVDDLDAIFLCSVQDYVSHQADKIESSLFSTFSMLAEFPGMGHRRTDLTRRPFLFFPNDPYLIAYERDIDPLLIHGVLHGSRDIRKLLRHRPA